MAVTPDCICSHHNLPDIPNLVYAPDGDRSCNTEDWVGSVFTSPCGDTAQVTCASCTNAGRCVTFLVNGQDVGHCHYLPSKWTAQYALCVCGSVIRMTYWDVYEIAPPQIGPGVNCGYQIYSYCGGLEPPWCYDANQHTRGCGDHDW